MLPSIAAWCARKGINIVGTGDWTHPEWFKHIRENLKEVGQGIYALNPAIQQSLSDPSASSDEPCVSFMLVTEISQIYKRGDKTRRVHNLVFSPSIETCEKVNAELARRGFNLKSDGRPILGIDSENFYRLLKEIDERIILVPAHAWTPWYSVFGSKSGFDSLQECFGEMSKYIYAIETGLSSDPAMNWGLSSLDSVICVSNSDAHSPRNLGREANAFEFDTNPSYDEFVRILCEKDFSKFKYTIEFFPQEGKYHFDGCAACKFSCDPNESKRLGAKCPSCGRALTLGVHNRVCKLSDRDSETVRAKKIPFRSIVPLAEIIAECFSVGSSGSKKVEEEYTRLTNELSDEFSILLDVPLNEIKRCARAPFLAEAIGRVREGKLEIKPGYDGVYGTVSIFGESGPVAAKQVTLI
jgi:uncharacterized protein (TIGR00375 family)